MFADRAHSHNGFVFERGFVRSGEEYRTPAPPTAFRMESTGILRLAADGPTAPVFRL